MRKQSNRESDFWKKTKKAISVKWKHFKRKVSKFFTPKRKKNLLIISCNLLAMLAVAFLVPYLTLNWIDDYTKHGEVIEVPDLSGKTLAEAEKILAGEKLGYTVIEKKFKEGRKKNEVLEQYPRARKYVKEGRKIALVLNTAERPKHMIPDVIDGSSYRQAVHRLAGEGFVVNEVDTISGERDWVYGLRYNGQELSNGMLVPRGAELTIVIGGALEKDTINEIVIDHSYFE